MCSTFLLIILAFDTRDIPEKEKEKENLKNACVKTTQIRSTVGVGLCSGICKALASCVKRGWPKPHFSVPSQQRFYIQNILSSAQVRPHWFHFWILCGCSCFGHKRFPENLLQKMDARGGLNSLTWRASIRGFVRSSFIITVICSHPSTWR